MAENGMMKQGSLLTIQPLLSVPPNSSTWSSYMFIH